MFQSVQSTGSKFKLACFRQRSKPGFLWMCTPKIPGNIDALFPTCSFIPCLFGASIFSEAPLFKLAINAQASLSRNCSVLNFFLFFSWVQHFCLKNGGFTPPKMADYWMVIPLNMIVFIGFDPSPSIPIFLPFKCSIQWRWTIFFWELSP